MKDELIKELLKFRDGSFAICGTSKIEKSRRDVLINLVNLGYIIIDDTIGNGNRFEVTDKGKEEINRLQ